MLDVIKARVVWRWIWRLAIKSEWNEEKVSQWVFNNNDVGLDFNIRLYVDRE